MLYIDGDYRKQSIFMKKIRKLCRLRNFGGSKSTFVCKIYIPNYKYLYHLCEFTHDPTCAQNSNVSCF